MWDPILVLPYKYKLFDNFMTFDAASSHLDTSYGRFTTAILSIVRPLVRKRAACTQAFLPSTLPLRPPWYRPSLNSKFLVFRIIRHIALHVLLTINLTRFPPLKHLRSTYTNAFKFKPQSLRKCVFSLFVCFPSVLALHTSFWSLRFDSMRFTSCN